MFTQYKPQGRGLLNNKSMSWDYVAWIAVDLRFKEKIVVIEEASSQGSVDQSNSSGKEAV